MNETSKPQTLEPRDLYLQAVAGLDAAIATVGTCDHDRATPCTGWNAHDLLEHVVMQQVWATELFAGHTLEEATANIGSSTRSPLGEDALTAWRTSSRAAEAALATCPDTRPIHTSAGKIAARADAPTTLLAMFGRHVEQTPIATVNELPALTSDLSAASVHELGTVLGVWAHPDDEAYLSAALMALAAGNGQRVACVTATKGEHDTSDPERWPPHTLATVREREMRSSLARLQVTEHRWLPHRDGEVALVPFERGTRSIYEIICEVSPDTIVTFGPDGMTGHPDHRAVGSWTTAAWRRSLTNKPSRLLHATKPERWADTHRVVNEQFDVFGKAGPPQASFEDIALVVEPTGAVLDAKMAALHAQSSQTTALREALGDAEYRRWSAEEYFVSVPVPALEHTNTNSNAPSAA